MTSSISCRSEPPRPRLPIANRTRGLVGIDPGPVPQLEHRQIPELVGVVGVAGEVVDEQAADRVGLEVAARGDTILLEQVLNPRPKLPSQPCAHRYPEALLGPVDEVVGQPPAA